jgi:hypothetical protein
VAEVEFYGEKFRLADEVNEFAVMAFADGAENIQADSMAGMAAVYRLLQSSIHEDDWARFKAHAFKNRANAETLMPVIGAVFEQAAERPTGRPADSSVGPEPTPPTSVSPPADAAMEQLSGRPDMELALMHTRGQHLQAVSA